jgi:hypothetical protein
MPIRLTLLWDNHITRRLPYGVPIEETKGALICFLKFRLSFGITLGLRRSDLPISLTLLQLPTSLLRLQNVGGWIASSARSKT